MIKINNLREKSKIRYEFYFFCYYFDFQIKK